jgi:hypothetical protein
MIWFKDPTNFTPRNLTVVMCFAIFTLIYWVNIINRKFQHSSLLKIPKTLTVGLNLLLVGIIYWSGNFGVLPSLVQYIWDPKTNVTQLPNSIVEQFRDGPDYYKQMYDWIKKHYPSLDSKITTIDVPLAYQLRQPSLVKYPFLPTTPKLQELHYQEIHDKISNGEITLLITVAEITDSNQIASYESMHNALENRYGENSPYQVSSTVLGQFKPVLAINQTNAMHVLWLNNSIS